MVAKIASIYYPLSCAQAAQAAAAAAAAAHAAVAAVAASTSMRLLLSDAVRL